MKLLLAVVLCFWSVSALADRYSAYQSVEYPSCETACLAMPNTAWNTSCTGTNKCLRAGLCISCNTTDTACNYYLEGTTTCVTSCPSGTEPSGIYCVAPPCPTGELAHFSCISAGTTACLDGCSYAVSAGTQTSTGFYGSAQSSGASCTDSGCSVVDAQTRSDICSGPSTGSEANLFLKQVLCDLTAQPCPAGQLPTAAGCAVPLPEGCIEIDGETVCAEADQNCVVIGGERICADQPDDESDREGCFWSYAIADWICINDAMVEQTGSTTTRSVDPVTGNTTVTTTSTTISNTTGATTTTTTTVVLDPDGNEISREIEGKTTGSEGSQLVYKAPAVPGQKADIEWAREKEEVLDELQTRWSEAPVVEAVMSFYEVDFGTLQGDCPLLCVPVFGDELCTTVHCDLMDEMATTIEAVFVAIWAFVAIRVVLSA